MKMTNKSEANKAVKSKILSLADIYLVLYNLASAIG